MPVYVLSPCAWLQPYNSIEQFRKRVMTRAMVDDYVLLRREIFVDAVRRGGEEGEEEGW